ncbi:MAG: ASCH domain-containing protein [Nitrososphaeraceae archaeon]
MDDNSMKCLSLRQPYAELLVSGKKTIELRKWNTNFRGEFLVHASKNVNKEKCKSLDIEHPKLTVGAITGRAILDDVRRYDIKAQFMKDKSRHYADANIFNSYMYGFMISNAHRFKYPVPYSGRLGFFEVDQSIIKTYK